MIINFTSCISYDYDLPLLPHFINHYNKLDIDFFRIIVHSKNEINLQTLLKTFQPIKHKLDLIPWVGKFDWKQKINLLNNNTGGDYTLTADVDEFQIWDTSLRDSIKEKEIIWGQLYDRETTNGKLAKIKKGKLEQQFPITSFKSKWEYKDYKFKPCLYPSTYKLSDPHNLNEHHQGLDKSDTIIVNHYRWIEGRYEKSVERINNYNNIYSTWDLENVLKLLEPKDRPLI
tara:strand:- start:123 stop:812 length:690 start_codon:yes stop_codon:yes gene_type:complete